MQELHANLKLVDVIHTSDAGHFVLLKEKKLLMKYTPFIAYLTKEMPVGYAQSDATFRAIPADLEDAGRILGGGRLRVLRDITAPLAKGGMIAAWCFIFIGVIRELSASII